MKTKERMVNQHVQTDEITILDEEGFNPSFEKDFMYAFNRSIFMNKNLDLKSKIPSYWPTLHFVQLTKREWTKTAYFPS